ncbi:hypothetical protein CFH99_07680 [Nocardioides aromaticivorans]|uniref:DUF2207 domain-containing protein n=1 Tax=Nocardioides aromaticivorans TaxID=200618 RepID=A0ABX7PHR4_9ACTN|nr:hypothetical protein [Nocardioides aromaticivorans]QSR25503.1 hypothetical protein CFH99_07680 [Nocardioides aromaticivorans]
MRRILAVGFFAMMASVLLVPRAGATEYSWRDASGGEDSYIDIRSVTVRNNADGLFIRIWIHPIDWEEFNPVGEYRLTIDTGGTTGPEFRDSTGLPGDGGFQALKGSRAYRASWSTYPYAGRCGRTVVQRWDLERGLIRTLIKPQRGCLFHPARVRINVRTVENGYFAEPDYGGYTVNDPPIVDQFPAPGRFTRWVGYTPR